MKIKVKLSQGSIQEARDQLTSTDEWLMEKTEELVRKLAEHGIPVIDRKIAQAQGDSNKNHYTHVDIVSFQTYARATLVVEGRDLLFIEYGAGVHYNGHPHSSPHPYGVQKGYTIGDYSPKHLGLRDSWFYRDAGGLHRSYGTEATMPVWSAYQSIIANYKKIAQEVFR